MLVYVAVSRAFFLCGMHVGVSHTCVHVLLEILLSLSSRSVPPSLFLSQLVFLHPGPASPSPLIFFCCSRCLCNFVVVPLSFFLPLLYLWFVCMIIMIAAATFGFIPMLVIL